MATRIVIWPGEELLGLWNGQPTLHRGSTARVAPTCCSGRIYSLSPFHANPSLEVNSLWWTPNQAFINSALFSCCINVSSGLNCSFLACCLVVACAACCFVGKMVLTTSLDCFCIVAIGTRCWLRSFSSLGCTSARTQSCWNIAPTGLVWERVFGDSLPYPKNMVVYLKLKKMFF